MFRLYCIGDDGVHYYWTDGDWSSDTRAAALMTEAKASPLADGLVCEYEEVPTFKRNTPMILFILIQNSKVIDRAITPNFLRLGGLDAYAGFQVAIGHINMRGEKAIVGVVANVAPLSGAKTWRISSDADGLYRLVGAGGCPAKLVIERLKVMQKGGKFDDLSNLPMRVVLTTVGPTTPLSTEDVSELLVP